MRAGRWRAVIRRFVIFSCAVLLVSSACTANRGAPGSPGEDGPSSPAPSGSVSPEVRRTLKEIARREAAERYCNAHPEAAATERCENTA